MRVGSVVINSIHCCSIPVALNNKPALIEDSPAPTHDKHRHHSIIMKPNPCQVTTTVRCVLEGRYSTACN